MSQNIVDLTFTREQLGALDANMASLETQLAPLTALTPERRRQLREMFDRSVVFCCQTVDGRGQNPGITPRNFDFEGLRRDPTTLDALRRMMAERFHCPGKPADEMPARRFVTQPFDTWQRGPALRSLFIAGRASETKSYRPSRRVTRRSENHPLLGAISSQSSA